MHREGLWHRAANVLLFRDDGQLLLQYRSPTKDVCPCVWDLSVAEHLLPGERYVDGAHRGLREELAIEGVLLVPLGEETKWVLEDPTLKIRDYEFQQCFIGVTDKTARLDSTEVADCRFCAIEDLRIEMRKSPARFTPWFVEIASRFDTLDLRRSLPD